MSFEYPDKRSFLSGDTVFHSFVDSLPGPLETAMYERGLADPGLLACHPRTDFRQLGLELRPVGTDPGASSQSSVTPCISPCISTNMACSIVGQDASTDTSPGAAEGNGAMWNTSLVDSPDFLASSCSVVSNLVPDRVRYSEGKCGLQF